MRTIRHRAASAATREPSDQRGVAPRMDGGPSCSRHQRLGRCALPPVRTDLGGGLGLPSPSPQPPPPSRPAASLTIPGKSGKSLAAWDGRRLGFPLGYGAGRIARSMRPRCGPHWKLQMQSGDGCRCSFIYAYWESRFDFFRVEAISSTRGRRESLGGQHDMRVYNSAEGEIEQCAFGCSAAVAWEKSLKAARPVLRLVLAGIEGRAWQESSTASSMVYSPQNLYVKCGARHLYGMVDSTILGIDSFQSRSANPKGSWLGAKGHCATCLQTTGVKANAWAWPVIEHKSVAVDTY